jgi:hypothetical protein
MYGSWLMEESFGVGSMPAEQFFDDRPQVIEPQRVLGLEQPDFPLDDCRQVLPSHLLKCW